MCSSANCCCSSFPIITPQAMLTENGGHVSQLLLQLSKIIYYGLNFKYPEWACALNTLSPALEGHRTFRWWGLPDGNRSLGTEL